MRSAILRAAAAAAFTAMAFAQAFQDDPGDFIKQGQALTRQGKFDDALQVYRNALQLNPNSYDANSAAGVALDLKGDYAEARKRFESAIQGSSGAQRVRALRDMVISYGFQGLCKEAEPYGRQAYNLQLEAKDYYGAGEVANELARVCIDSGDLDAAEKWYRTGYETGMKQPDIKPDRRNLWEFRWEHAQGRLAARRGNREVELSDQRGVHFRHAWRWGADVEIAGTAPQLLHVGAQPLEGRHRRPRRPRGSRVRFVPRCSGRSGERREA
jgi:tetratricopeptide (TPR) repeat protein